MKKNYENDPEQYWQDKEDREIQEEKDKLQEWEKDKTTWARPYGTPEPKEQK